MFDIAQAHDKVAAVVSSRVGVDDGMSLLIDYCAENEPWHGWNVLRKLEFASDQQNLKQWLDQLLTHEPPPHEIKAFWFGLFNPVINGKSTCGLYLAGTETFDGNDEDFEWACDPAWFPSERYAESQVLDGISQQLNTVNNTVLSFEYVLCLGYAGLVVNHLAATLPFSKWLGNKSSRALAIGFDSGAGIVLGSFTKQGWKPSTP
jgi:hypothetical protein